MNRYRLAQSLGWHSELGLKDMRSESLAHYVHEESDDDLLVQFSQSVRYDLRRFHGHNSISCNLGKGPCF